MPKMLSACLKVWFGVILGLASLSVSAQMKATDIKIIEFYSGTFQFDGKLGSYNVREHKFTHLDIEPKVLITDSSLFVGSEEAGVTKVTIKAKQGLRYFGGGEQFSHVELTGEKVPFLVEENGIGRGDQPATRTANLVGAGGHEWTTYCPIPLVLNTANEAYLIKNDCYSEIDLSIDGEITFVVHDNEIDIKYWEADSPSELLEQITAHLGRMPELPDWTYGTILGIQGGAERVKKLVNEANSHGNPVCAIWIQDWVGKKQTSIGSRLRWEWKPDTLTYPDFRQFCSDMNAQDVKVMGYINPFLLEETDMTNEALVKGYIIHKKDGTPYLIPFGGFKGYIIDLSNPDAWNWIKNIIKTNMISNGLSGWMADFAEWLPFDCKLYSGQDPKDYHNRFAADWAKVNREAVEEAGKLGEVVFFSRSGFTGSSGISTLFWAGDQHVDFGPNDGLGSAITAMLSSGLSGLAINHSDVGGYTALKFPFFKNYLRDKETLYRWIEFEAFTPIYRTHEGLLPDDMVQYYSDSSSQEFFARFGQIHKRLEPYFKLVIKEAAETGIPAIRHPWVVCPEDTNCLNTEYQFFVGNDLLMLPITERGASSIMGYFPTGEWRHLLTGEMISGPNHQEVKAPIGIPAVYVRGGGDLEAILSGRARDH